MLVDDDRVVIGHAAGCTIRLPDRVCERHLAVTCVNGRVFVEPAIEDAVVMVNDVRLLGRGSITFDDTVTIGRTVIVLEPPSVVPEREIEVMPATLSQVELDFLATLRGNPSDDTTRAIYADWLEAAGYRIRAAYVRLELARAAHLETSEVVAAAVRITDPVWRAAIARRKIRMCDERDCPRWWHCLKPDHDLVRPCRVCRHDVTYATTRTEITECGIDAAPVVFDAGVLESEGTAAYTRPSRLRG